MKKYINFTKCNIKLIILIIVILIGVQISQLPNYIYGIFNKPITLQDAVARNMVLDSITPGLTWSEGDKVVLYYEARGFDKCLTIYDEEDYNELYRLMMNLKIKPKLYNIYNPLSYSEGDGDYKYGSLSVRFCNAERGGAGIELRSCKYMVTNEDGCMYTRTRAEIVDDDAYSEFIKKFLECCFKEE